ncbi:hypothetical protein BDM02DRAFT_3189816 [Thelephora ganbajun]|uniref:Uncharacterized protein n=1 Tax=Thelephora ganbajun TaxID=370292 RepID=A0ACB6Z7Q1_THEGA|nr:hypothetical protein BDM02DRAFT_3189816 [Thelephora ganbajun]
MQEAECQELSKKLTCLHKKHKHLEKALDANKSPGESEDLILYPTGEVPGQGKCHLINFLGHDKATYNAFACPDVLKMCVQESAIAAGISKTSLWDDVPPVALGEVIDVVREQYLWLSKFKNSWPMTTILKQFFRNSQNATSQKGHTAWQTPTVAPTPTSSLDPT